MKRPSDEIVDVVAPPRDIEGLPIQDAGVRNVAHAEMRDTARIPRGGPYEATLVAARKHYDGGGGGVPGAYYLLYVEFRAAGSRWRTSGVAVKQPEAARVARDLLKAKPSKPGRGEPARVGGKVTASEDSELLGVGVKGGTYLLFVKHLDRSGAWARTRGVELLDTERPIVAGLLKQLAAAEGD